MAEAIVNLLQEYKDCFTLEYSKMLGLDRNLVEHHDQARLQTLQAIAQPLLKKLLRSQQRWKKKSSASWTLNSSGQSVTRNGCQRKSPLSRRTAKEICIDFKKMNLARPKDEYPMPIVNIKWHCWLQGFKLPNQSREQTPPSKSNPITRRSIRQQAKNDTLIGGLPIIPPWDRWCIAAMFEYLGDRSSHVRSAWRSVWLTPGRSKNAMVDQETWKLLAKHNDRLHKICQRMSSVKAPRTCIRTPSDPEALNREAVSRMGYGHNR